VKLRLWLAACCVGLIFPASASAIKCAPPGNSQVDQYFATVPGSICNFPASGPAGGGSHGSLPPGTSRQLSTQGSVGQAVKRLVSRNNTNGSNGQSTNGKSSVNKGSRAGAPLSGSGSGPVSGLLKPLSTGSSSGGVGVLLPIFLIGALVLGVGVVALRLARRSSGPQP
jgi:hypothetical protein